MIKLDEKIRDSSQNMEALLNAPQSTKFEFQVLQIVIPEDFLSEDLAEGFDPATLKLLYSVSDQEQGQFFSTKGQQTAKVEQNGLRFYRAVFNDKFAFDLTDTTTDTLNIKVFTTMNSKVPPTQPSQADQQASSPDRGETEIEDTREQNSKQRMLECLKFRLKDKLINFFDQQETIQEMKQTKCKIAFKGRWLHNQDLLKYQTLKDQLNKKYAST